eukprot:1150619-Pelagomonas_calceolata.AAC.1
MLHEWASMSSVLCLSVCTQTAATKSHACCVACAGCCVSGPPCPPCLQPLVASRCGSAVPCASSRCLHGRATMSTCGKVQGLRTCAPVRPSVCAQHSLCVHCVLCAQHSVVRADKHMC